VIAEQHHLALHGQVDALARVGAVTDDVAEAVNLGNMVSGNVREDGLERFQIAVNVADYGFHVL
jgi:hypothetical protein